MIRSPRPSWPGQVPEQSQISALTEPTTSSFPQEPQHHSQAISHATPSAITTTPPTVPMGLLHRRTLPMRSGLQPVYEGCLRHPNTGTIRRNGRTEDRHGSRDRVGSLATRKSVITAMQILSAIK